MLRCCVLKTYIAVLAERFIHISELSKYLESGDWYELFDDSERGHAVIFLYHLMKWGVRDKADLLELKPAEFTWSRNKKVIGTFPLTIPTPTPSFSDLLSEIFDKDPIVRKYFDIDYIGTGTFKISRK